MNFFEKIYRLITGQPDDTDRKIENRILELKEGVRKDGIKLEHLKKTSFVLKWYALTTAVKDFKPINVFTVKAFKKVPTMQELLDKREEEEKKRILKLRETVKTSFGTIHQLLNKENVEEADTLLYQILPYVKQINDGDLSATFNSLKEELKNTKEALRQREIQRLEEEKQRKLEEEQRRKAEEEKRKKQEEEERKKKEKEAKEYEEKLAREESTRNLEIEQLKVEATRKKLDANDFIEHLRMKNVACFYHFTEKSNLQSIRKYRGLYSWYYCKQKNILIPSPGGDYDSRNLDVRHGLQDYVRLSFCHKHPMAYVKRNEALKRNEYKDFVILHIAIDVAGFMDTQFSDMNAADNRENHGGSYQDLKNVNIPLTKSNYLAIIDPLLKKQYQAECMVKTFIPIEYIVNIDNPERL